MALIDERLSEVLAGKYFKMSSVLLTFEECVQIQNYISDSS